MSKYRDRLKIVADILSIADDKAKKTRIMYQANLSYRLLCRYLGEVVDAGLVKHEDSDCYMLTAKGREFLARHEEYSKRCRNLEKQSIRVNNEKRALECMCLNAERTGRHLSRVDRSKESGS